MGIIRLTTAALAMATAVVAAALPAQEDAATERSSQAKVCDDTTKICYSEYVSSNSVSFRIAIPDTATAASPFDIALSIVAPKSIGWAAIAWGGAMANNPLTLGWANDATAVVSSRRATGHTFPTAYTDASYTVLPSSSANTTHWKLDVVCSGCSHWTGSSGKASIDPASTAVALAFASSATAPATPASNTSRFGIHNTKGKWTHDFSSAKLADFGSLVQAAEKAAA